MLGGSCQQNSQIKSASYRATGGQSWPFKRVHGKEERRSGVATLLLGRFWGLRTSNTSRDRQDSTVNPSRQCPFLKGRISLLTSNVPGVPGDCVTHSMDRQTLPPPHPYSRPETKKRGLLL